MSSDITAAPGVVLDPWGELVETAGGWTSFVGRDLGVPADLILVEAAESGRLDVVAGGGSRSCAAADLEALVAGHPSGVFVSRDVPAVVRAVEAAADGGLAYVNRLLLDRWRWIDLGLLGRVSQSDAKAKDGTDKGELLQYIAAVIDRMHSSLTRACSPTVPPLDSGLESPNDQARLSRAMSAGGLDRTLRDRRRFDAVRVRVASPAAGTTYRGVPAAGVCMTRRQWDGSAGARYVELPPPAPWELSTAGRVAKAFGGLVRGKLGLVPGGQATESSPGLYFRDGRVTQLLDACAGARWQHACGVLRGSGASLCYTWDDKGQPAIRNGYLITTRTQEHHLRAWLAEKAARVVDAHNEAVPILGGRDGRLPTASDLWGVWAGCDDELAAWRDLSRLVELRRLATRAAGDTVFDPAEFSPRLRYRGVNLEAYRRLGCRAFRPAPGRAFVAGRVPGLRLHCFATVASRSPPSWAPFPDWFYDLCDCLPDPRDGLTALALAQGHHYGVDYPPRVLAALTGRAGTAPFGMHLIPPPNPGGGHGPEDVHPEVMQAVIDAAPLGLHASMREVHPQRVRRGLR